MVTKKVYEKAKIQAAKMIREAGIVITDREPENIEVVDFGLGNLQREGVQVLTFFNTKRIAAKILVLFPNQTEPEHWHPQVGNDPGKEETIRIIKGTVRFYLPGEDNMRYGFIPPGKEDYYTARNEIIMKPGDQLTIEPGTKHWFQTDDNGAVMYSFSTCVRDVLDQFTDSNIVRSTQIDDSRD